MPKVWVTDLSIAPVKFKVRVGNCPHDNFYIKDIHGLWFSGEESAEVINQLKICSDCKDVIMNLNEERSNEVDYDYTE